MLFKFISAEPGCSQQKELPKQNHFNSYDWFSRIFEEQQSKTVSFTGLATLYDFLDRWLKVKAEEIIRKCRGSREQDCIKTITVYFWSLQFFYLLTSNCLKQFSQKNHNKIVHFYKLKFYFQKKWVAGLGGKNTENEDPFPDFSKFGVQFRVSRTRTSTRTSTRTWLSWMAP